VSTYSKAEQSTTLKIPLTTFLLNITNIGLI